MWQGRGRELLGPIAYIDVDGTLAPTYGKRKQGMAISYKGIWGYAPLVVSRWPTPSEVLYVVNRPGNVPSHTDAAQWILEPWTTWTRTPSGSASRRHGLLSDRALRPVGREGRLHLRHGREAALRSRAEALDEACWQRLERAPRYETLTGQKRQRFQADEKERIVASGATSTGAELRGRGRVQLPARQVRQPYRVVALRKNISKMKGEHVLFDEIRYFFYITTRTDLSAAEVVRCANERCDQENIIEQLKNGVNALRVPLYDLVSNWAYMVIAALAWKIKSWFALMMHRKSDRSEYIRMEFRRFIHSIILIPCRVMRRARTITLG